MPIIANDSKNGLLIGSCSRWNWMIYPLLIKRIVDLPIKTSIPFGDFPGWSLVASLHWTMHLCHCRAEAHAFNRPWREGYGHQISKYGGNPINPHKTDGLEWSIRLKWMIWRYLHFRKPPCIHIISKSYSYSFCQTVCRKSMTHCPTPRSPKSITKILPNPCNKYHPYPSYCHMPYPTQKKWYRTYKRTPLLTPYT